MTNGTRNKVLIGSLCAIGCETCYGLSYGFTKAATLVASPFALLAWRFVVAVLFLGAGILLGIARVDFRGKSLRALLPVVALCPALYFIGETFGIKFSGASESGIFLAVIPVVAIIASTIMLRKRPSRQQVVGICITFAGVVTTTLAAGLRPSFSVPGYLFLLLAVLSYSLYMVYVIRAHEFSGVELTFAMLVAGAVTYVLLACLEALIDGGGAGIVALLTLPTREHTVLWAALYQGIVCGAISFLLGNVAIQYLGVNRDASFVGISTFVSILAGVLLLGEPFSLLQGVGAAIIIAGVIIANWRTGEDAERGQSPFVTSSQKGRTLERDELDG